MYSRFTDARNRTPGWKALARAELVAYEELVAQESAAKNAPATPDVRTQKISAAPYIQVSPSTQKISASPYIQVAPVAERSSLSTTAQRAFEARQAEVAARGKIGDAPMIAYAEPTPPPTPTPPPAPVVPDNSAQTKAIADTKRKLADAQSAYSGLQGKYESALLDMDEMQGEFDSLFGNYGSLNTNFGALQGTYDELTGNYGALETSQGELRDELGAAASRYDTLSGELDALLGQYDTQAGSLNTLQGQYGGLSDSFDALTSTQAKTLADFEAERDAALGLRGEMRGNQSDKFLAANDADRARRASSGLGSMEARTQPAYTQAMDALASTELDPMGYQMAPIDFTGGFDPSLLQPTQLGGLADLGAYGTTDYADISAGPQMSMNQGGFDMNQSFNPYFDAINQQYGVNIPSAGGQG